MPSHRLSNGLQRPTSSPLRIRHLSSSLARRRPEEAKASAPLDVQAKEKPAQRKGILAKMLPASMIPAENSAGGLRKLISLMRPERKTLYIAVGLVSIFLCWFNLVHSSLNNFLALSYMHSSPFPQVFPCLFPSPSVD